MDRVAEALVRVDALCERMDAIIETRSGGHVTTQIHKTEGLSAWTTAAVCACFFTYLSLIIFAVWSIFQINNLTAWKDVYGRDLAAMRQQLIQIQGKP